jgi:hypothetical protein
MKPRVTLCVSLLTLLVAAASPLRSDEEFPKILPVSHFTQIDPIPKTGLHCTIFQTWTQQSESKPSRELHQWLTDPWGLNEAAELEQERNHEYRLRLLGDKMRDTFGSSEDPLQALWQGLKTKIEPTGQVKIRQVMTQSYLYSKAKIDMPDGNSADPYAKRNWRAEETLRMSLPMWEPAFVFGHFNTRADSFQYRELNAVAKTGVGVRWVPMPKSEVLVRGGPMVSYLDTNTSRIQEQNHFAVEVLAFVPLWGPFSLEYTGGAFAATMPNTQNLINQDFRIAMPLSNNSEFYFGASQRFDSSMSQVLWTERRQLYIGIELKR